MTAQYSIYFAGELFDHKHLIGNALLASYIDNVSEGRYRCVVPQDLEQATTRAADIRNNDLKHLMECDLAIFNFDGTELDSGTVVEFMFSRFLDIPCIILRSDFRRSGDQLKDGDDWNLMCSFYPRTRKVQFNAMEWYQEETAKGGTLQDVTERLYTRIALALITELDGVRSEPPVLEGASITPEQLYTWAIRFAGGGFAEYIGDDGFVERVIEGKKGKGR
jgi:nucleoside 2-deoxyribosyltransferase